MKHIKEVLNHNTFIQNYFKHCVSPWHGDSEKKAAKLSPRRVEKLDAIAKSEEKEQEELATEEKSRFFSFSKRKTVKHKH